MTTQVKKGKRKSSKHITLTKQKHHHHQISSEEPFAFLFEAFLDLIFLVAVLQLRFAAVVPAAPGPSPCSWSIATVKRATPEKERVYIERLIDYN